MSYNEKPTSDLLVDVINCKGQDKDNITLFEIKVALHERGFVVLILLFAIPLSIPLPAPPGFSTLLALPLLLLSYQMLMNFDSPWLPRWLTNRSVKRATLALIIEKTNPFLRKLERFMRPRYLFIFCDLGKKFVSILFMISAVLIAVPIPFMHFIPAWGVVLSSLGLLSKDGLMVVLGSVVSFIGILTSGMIFFLGPKLVSELFSLLFRIS